MQVLRSMKRKNWQKRRIGIFLPQRFEQLH
jgi:hypothetical protein